MRLFIIWCGYSKFSNNKSGIWHLTFKSGSKSNWNNKRSGDDDGSCGDGESFSMREWQLSTAFSTANLTLIQLKTHHLPEEWGWNKVNSDEMGIWEPQWRLHCDLGLSFARCTCNIFFSTPGEVRRSVYSSRGSSQSRTSQVSYFKCVLFRPFCN